MYIISLTITLIVFLSTCNSHIFYNTFNKRLIETEHNIKLPLSINLSICLDVQCSQLCHKFVRLFYTKCLRFFFLVFTFDLKIPRQYIFLLGNMVNQITGNKLPFNGDCLRVLFYNMCVINLNLLCIYFK
jgi:hypothetical protein